VYSGLYSEAVVSSVASAVALAEVGQFKEAVQYLQKAAKALYEAAKEVFERVKVTVQRLVELFVEAVVRVLAWIDEHKAYLFLMAAVAAGLIALSAALNLWGLIELDKLAYAASLTPFIPAGVKEYSREEVFNMFKNESDPYEKFKKIANDANAGRVKLAEPWESLRVLIGKAHRELDEGKKKALFYAVLALEETFGVYRTALREYVEERGKAVQRMEVGEEPFKQVAYMADLSRLTQQAEKEEVAFENALKILRERLNEYAVKHSLRNLLDVDENMARRLAEVEDRELSKFKDVSFGVKAYAALIAYREYALGKRCPYGAAAWYWLEVGGSAWLLYYAPSTAHREAKRAKVERPVAVEELVAEALRRLFLKPGSDHHRSFIEELTKSGKLALMLEKGTESSYVFRLFRLEEGGGLKELEGVKLWISKVGEGIVYFLELDARWRELFKQEFEVTMKAAERIGGRLLVKDHLPYMLSWIDSDVAIRRKRKKRVLAMSTSHLWQLAETQALFGWSVVGLHMSLTLEGPKLQLLVEAPLDKLDETIKRSARDGWLKTLGIKAESWDGLKQWVANHWDEVIDVVKKRLEGVKASSNFDLVGALEELKGLRSKIADDKVAREVVAPALLLIQAERLGVNEETLRYFGAVISGAVGGDGHVSAARKEVGLTSGERAVALLWAAALAAYGIETEIRDAGSAFNVTASGGGAARLARLYFLYGPPLLEGGDERVINHKLAEAVELGAEGLSIRWEGLRRTPSGRVAADLIISEASVALEYNVYLSNEIGLYFESADRNLAELAARLLRLVGVSAELKRKEGSREVWRVIATTDKLAAGREELRKALAEIVKKACDDRLIDTGKAERWLKKLEKGRVLKEGWPKYHVGLASSGALEVKYQSTDRNSIEREAQRLEKMGLKRGFHFTVEMPGEGRDGYVYIRREGLAYAAWLSLYGSGEQQRLAAEFIEYILQRAKEEGEEVYEKAREIIEEGKARGSIKLEGFEGRVEVGGKEHVVKVLGGGAEFDKGRGGKPLLRIRITAEVDGVKSEYMITFSRRGGDNAVLGFATAKADAPGGRETDAERLAAVIKALTGRAPRIRRRSDGTIIIECGREHLEGFKRYAELADAIAKWVKETSL
jgi:hypothetical protein